MFTFVKTISSPVCRAAFQRVRPLSTTANHRNMTTEGAFIEHGLVPDVLPRPPPTSMTVSFTSGAKVQNGNVLTPTQVQNKPDNVRWPSKEGELYTLCMTDPDAPSRKEPKFREWHHWLVVNIPGNDISKGDTLAEYIGSGPPHGTGLHRYVYVVYKQQGHVEDKEHGVLKDNSGDNRGGFHIAKFADQHQLGDPIAGNFYNCEWDSYVPKLYEKLSGK